jgi:hypothetical protein
MSDLVRECEIRPCDHVGASAQKAQTGLYSDAASGVFRPASPEHRIKDQERDGVGAEVIYGILGLSRRVQDGEAMGVVFRIYNDFVMQFRKFNPDRFAPLACLPNHDPKAGAEELRRIAKLGLIRNGADSVGFCNADMGS